jgi:hypothetical protein
MHYKTPFHVCMHVRFDVLNTSILISDVTTFAIRQRLLNFFSLDVSYVANGSNIKQSLFVVCCAIVHAGMNQACSQKPCLNDGVCVESPNTQFSYTCQCAQGFDGRNCESKIMFC